MTLFLSACDLEMKSWFVQCQINTAVHMCSLDCRLHAQLCLRGPNQPTTALAVEVSNQQRFYKFCWLKAATVHTFSIFERTLHKAVCCILEIRSQWWWDLSVSLGVCSSSPSTKCTIPGFSSPPFRVFIWVGKKAQRWILLLHLYTASHPTWTSIYSSRLISVHLMCRRNWCNLSS